MSWAKKLIYGILMLGSLLPISFGLYSGMSWISMAGIGFFLWALAPYVGFGLLTYWTKNTRVLFALIVLAAILVSWAAYMWVNLTFVHLDPQNPIALLIFVPLYQLGFVILVGVGLAGISLYTRSSRFRTET
jgi:hypothetical protein